MLVGRNAHRLLWPRILSWMRQLEHEGGAILRVEQLAFVAPHDARQQLSAHIRQRCLAALLGIPNHGVDHSRQFRGRMQHPSSPSA